MQKSPSAAFAIVITICFLPGLARADDAKLTWTHFVDPAEHAMAVDMPAGWMAKGGVMRISPINAYPWVTATSPDGSIEVFIGDPTLPGYRMLAPSQAWIRPAAEGQMVPGGSQFAPPVMALDYLPGAEFAKYYAPAALATAGCADAAVTGTQPMPDVAKFDHDRVVAIASKIRATFAYTPPPHEAGLATFTCQSGGQTLSAGVIADTTPPEEIPFWSAGVAGYLTTRGQEDWALAILHHMILSRQYNPQWDKAMQDAEQEAVDKQQQLADSQMAQLLANEQGEMNAIKAQGAAEMQTLTSEHQAFMAQMNQQAAARNASFASYEAAKGLNNWNFIAHEVRGGALYRDTGTGRIFEIDP